MKTYQRYSISIKPAPNLFHHPSRFRVHVRRFELIKLLLKEFIETRGDLELTLSRPCVYGVFGGPLGGLTPRERLCVGCLRCTIQHPEVVQIQRNPERMSLGDSFFDPDKVDTVLYEAASGRIPVRGAGYGGRFGGEGWDAIWTDMSEIVRPTRDGIHGREFISTTVDIGGRPAFLRFGPEGEVEGGVPRSVPIGVPVIFDRMPVDDGPLNQAIARTAQATETLAILPSADFDQFQENIVPLAKPAEVDSVLARSPKLAELDGWDEASFLRLAERLPQALIWVRVPYGGDLMPMFEAGVRVFHLIADFHGNTADGFVAEAIWDAHQQLLRAGVREQVTLIGSGGIAAAEHVPKAIIRGLDAVAIDTAALIAVQAEFQGEVLDRSRGRVVMPEFEIGWAEQRLTNLLASWRDQLLEVLGAMGLREVRRLRGEIGRSMTQIEMEREAFSEIPGFGAAHER